MIESSTHGHWKIATEELSRNCAQHARRTRQIDTAGFVRPREMNGVNNFVSSTNPLPADTPATAPSSPKAALSCKDGAPRSLTCLRAVLAILVASHSGPVLTWISRYEAWSADQAKGAESSPLMLSEAQRAYTCPLCKCLRTVLWTSLSSFFHIFPSRKRICRIFEVRMPQKMWSEL